LTSKPVLIAHRGNVFGPEPDLENSPRYLLAAISLGLDVEVDVWMINGEFYLGHDEPDYLVDKKFLTKIRHRAWFHCKNLDVLTFFSRSFMGYRYFWHQEDSYTLTSTGHIWTYPGLDVGSKSIIVDLSCNWSYSRGEVYGVCFDYLPS
jgi:hypothetical protein